MRPFRIRKKRPITVVRQMLGSLFASEEAASLGLRAEESVTVVYHEWNA